MNRNVIKDTGRMMDRMEREIRRTTHNQKLGTYLDRNLKQEKMLDMATLVDLTARIGGEENQEIYDEFLGLLVDCIDKIFYSQSNRRKMHFPKYRALFQLFANELKADVNHVPGQVFFNKGELFLRTSPPQIDTEVK